MSTVSLNLPNDGEDIDASDVNGPFNDIAQVINGNIDNDNIKAGANIDGSKLADGTIGGAKITDGEVTGAKIADGSITNAKLDTTAGELGGAWQNFAGANITGMTTSPNFGSTGVKTGSYCQIGKTVVYKFYFEFSGTGISTGSGQYMLELPVPASLSQTGATLIPVGQGRAIDNSTGNDAMFFPEIETASTAQLAYPTSLGSTGGVLAMENDSPWIWASGDKIAGQITYEAA